MEAATAQVPQVSKRLYRNNTGGWVGVIQLDHQGAEKGVNIEPFGTIWLSDAEVILTARAPVRPQDNPFEEQVFWVRDQATGERREMRIRPVTLESNDARYVPANDRYVPPHINEHEGRAMATAAATGAEPESVSVGSAVAERTAQIIAEAQPSMQAATETAPPEAGPPSTGSASPSPAAPPAPVHAAPEQPGPPLRTDTPSGPPSAPRTGLSGESSMRPPTSEAESWVREAPAPGQVLAGSLSGSNEGASAGGDPTLVQPGDAVHVPQNAPVPPMTPGAAAGEEHAAAVDPQVGEETGAARPPAQPQPEGEFASREEVGSPNAPTQVQPEGGDSGLIG